MFKRIKAAWKTFVSFPYEQAAKELEIKINVSKAEEKPKDISEPVLTIVKTFSEKGRWKIKATFDPFRGPLRNYPSFRVVDSISKEEHTLLSESFYYQEIYGKLFIAPQYVVSRSLPSWMSDTEKKYVAGKIDEYGAAIKQRFLKIQDRENEKWEKQAKINQDKERNRLMSVYCNQE